MKGLLTWLVLIPLILGTLICCGQLATFLISADKGGNTSSLLSADYRPWEYEKIPPINIAAFMRDIQDVTPTVIIGQHWVFPSKTVYPIAQNPSQTSTPRSATRTTPTSTRIISLTPTIPTSTPRITSTVLPTITRTTVPSSTVTRTLPPLPPIPTSTNTQQPPPPRATASITPTPTQTATTVVPTPITPTITFTFTPSATTETPPGPTFTFTPTYAPVWPIAEDEGRADQMPNNGCRAYFGYRNDNPYEVMIEVGPLNYLSDPAAVENPPQPTHFLVGPVFGAFEFTWYSGTTLVWTLDGRTATADWCYPP